jgi:hypothetical protein
MSKFFEIQGEVVKKIRNKPIEKEKVDYDENGNQKISNYTIGNHFLVIKWVSFYQGEEYVDYIPLEYTEFSGTKNPLLRDVYEGYVVKVKVLYECKPRGLVETQSRNWGGVNHTLPKIYPKFKLIGLEIVNSDNNIEARREHNEEFKYGLDEPEDMPF